MNEKLQLAAALKIIQGLLKGEGREEAESFLAGVENGTLPKPTKFRLTVTKSEPTMPGFGAYVIGSIKTETPDQIPTGQVLLNLDATLWACVDSKDLNWNEVAADSVSHEMLHVIQELLGQNLTEWHINETIEKTRTAWREGEGETFSTEEPDWFAQLDSSLANAAEGAFVIFVDPYSPEQTLVLEKMDMGDPNWQVTDWQVSDVVGLSLDLDLSIENKPYLKSFSVSTLPSESEEEDQT